MISIRMFASALAAAALSSLTVGCGSAPADDAGQQSEEELSFSRSKRDYCCFAKNDVGSVMSCRAIRDYRDEIGRLSALNNCQSTFMGSDWQSHELVSATCSDRPECPPPPLQPPQPPPAPTCSNGAAEGAQWTDRRPGTTCEFVTYACRNLQIVEIGSRRSPNCIEQ